MMIQLCFSYFTTTVLIAFEIEMSSQTLFLADSIYTQVLISVWLWNFKDGGSLKARFLSKHQHNQRNKNPSMTCSSSKSAKIVLSKSIFDVKNQPFFLKKKII